MRKIACFLLSLIATQSALATTFTCPDPTLATTVNIVRGSIFSGATLSSYYPPSNLACLYHNNAKQILCVAHGDFKPLGNWQKGTPPAAFKCSGTVAACPVETPTAAPIFDNSNCNTIN